MLPSPVRLILACGFYALLAVSTPPVRAAEDASDPGFTPGFVLLSADENALQIEHRLDPPAFGVPDIRPIATTRIAIPPGARATARMTVLEEEPAAWTSDLDASQRAELLASLEAELPLLAEPSVLRNQTVVELRHAWLRLGPDGSPRQIIRAQFSIAIDRRGTTELGRATGSDAFEGLYRSVLINYEQGRAWRMVPPRPGAFRGSEYFSSTDAPWIKVWCDREDIYSILGSDLEKLGVDLEAIDPLTLRLFTPRQTVLAEAASVDDAPSWMSPLPIHLEGMEDGRFDAHDQIWFLGYGPDAWFTSKGFTQPGLEAFARDPYTNENPYWLTWGGSFAAPPARMEERPADDVFEPFADRVRDRIHLEEDEVYNPRMKELQTGGADWELYWWRERIANQGRDDVSPVTVSIPDPVEGDSVSLLARFWGANNSRGDTSIVDHDLELLLNGHFIDRRTWEGYTRNDFTGQGHWLQAGDTQVFQMIIHGHEDPAIARSDQINLAFIDLEYTRWLRARDDAIAFFPGGLSGMQSFAVSGFSAGDVLVVDATDSAAPSLLRGASVADGGSTTVRFRANVDEQSALPTRFVLRRASLLRVPRLETDTPPPEGYLRERTEAAQMIIVTHDRFRPAAERLATYRRANFPDRSEADVAIVDIRDIFDEFSFGRPDPVAMRNFLQWVRVRWNGGNPDDGPAYVLLMGDAHRDARGKEVENPTNFVPTYTRYYYVGYLNDIYDPRFSSDDFFAFLDGPFDTELDLFLGRLSVETLPQASTAVDKIIRYENESDLGPWRDRVTLVADDLCQGTSPDGLGWQHLIQTEELADQIFPSTLQLDRIYLVEYGAECAFTNKPEVANSLLRSMNEGTLVVDFTGHGSESQLADERIFEVSSVGSLTNADRLFLFLTASCSVGKFDVSTPSLAEALMRHPSGGAISVFSASSVASSSGNADVNRGFFSEMFPAGDVTRVRPIGEAALQAKIAARGNLNDLRFALHGDPALRLLTPRSAIELNTAAVSTGAASADTLHRGVLTELTGRVVDSAGEVMSDFDGHAEVRVFDSELVRREFWPTRQIEVKYELSGVPIYRGSATVTKGEFAVRFQVPTALRTGDRGPAQIYVYAEDGESDAAGALPELFVPEVVPPPSSDQDGPTIALSLGREGDSVAPGAEITATFFDSSGVNVTSLVPSRAVIFRIEENGEVLLAEDVSNLVTFGDDYRSGQLRHRLSSSLVPGKQYEAVLEASDNINNRSGLRSEFSISGSGDLGFRLGRVFNLPNPTEQATHFLGELSEEAYVEVEIFTLAGRRVTRLSEARLTPEQFASAGIGWDGRDDDGDRLSNGVYLYKVTARPVAGGAARDRIERLVVSR